MAKIVHRAIVDRVTGTKEPACFTKERKPRLAIDSRDVTCPDCVEFSESFFVLVFRAGKNFITRLKRMKKL